MSTMFNHPGDHDPAFPNILDDDAPESTADSEPTRPSTPGDSYLGAQMRGVTAAEAHEGEPLEWKLQRESPEHSAEQDDQRGADNQDSHRGQGDDQSQDSYDPDRDGDANYDAQTRMYSDPEGPYAGRLIEPDEGAHSDTESTAIASEYFSEEDDLSPEESAMHVEFGR